MFLYYIWCTCSWLRSNWRTHTYTHVCMCLCTLFRASNAYGENAFVKANSKSIGRPIDSIYNINLIPLKPLATDRMGPDEGGYFCALFILTIYVLMLYQFEWLGWGTHYLLILVSNGNLPGWYFTAKHHQRQTLLFRTNLVS